VVRSQSEQRSGASRPEPLSRLPHSRDGRHASPDQRLDRHRVEILPELRVTQTGTPLLTGTLLLGSQRGSSERG
jgi:hypothetical protein